MINPLNIIGQKTKTSFSFFLFVLFIIAVGDAVMSYVTPVFLDAHIENPLWIGVIFSTSSAVGFIFDMYAGAYLKRKTHKFFMICTSIVALAFPLLLLFGANKVLFYILAMASWGIYYESRAFSIYTYIKSLIPRQSYPLAWGMVENFNSIAYLIGPIVASYLLIKSINTPLYFALALFSVGFMFTVIFLKNSKHIKKDTQQHLEKADIRLELRVWKILSGRLWVIWILWFLLWCVDASFWGVGILLAEKLKLISIQGEYLIPLFMIPKTFMGFTVAKLAKGNGKKYVALISSIIGGLALIFLGLGKGINTILVFTFLGSASFSIAVIALSSTFEEYIERLGKYGPELIGLEQTASSLAYIITPIISFYVASILSEQIFFAFLGTAISLWASIALFVIPRKIKMPQSKLKSI